MDAHVLKIEDNRGHVKQIRPIKRVKHAGGSYTGSGDDLQHKTGSKIIELSLSLNT